MRYSKQDCIEALQEAAEVYGDDLSAAQYREFESSPSDRTILNRFGTWNAAKEAADLNSTYSGLTLENKRSPVPHRTGDRGYERWDVSNIGRRHTVRVHRLLAVAEFGFDAVAGKDVHHVNGLSWDNRAENLALMDHAEHTSHHRQKENS